MVEKESPRDNRLKDTLREVMLNGTGKKLKPDARKILGAWAYKILQITEAENGGRWADVSTDNIYSKLREDEDKPLEELFSRLKDFGYRPPTSALYLKTALDTTVYMLRNNLINAEDCERVKDERRSEPKGARTRKPLPRRT